MTYAISHVSKEADFHTWTFFLIFAVICDEFCFEICTLQLMYFSGYVLGSSSETGDGCLFLKEFVSDNILGLNFMSFF